jgi:hypothetical protein
MFVYYANTVQLGTEDSRKVERWLADSSRPYFVKRKLFVGPSVPQRCEYCPSFSVHFSLNFQVYTLLLKNIFDLFLGNEKRVTVSSSSQQQTARERERRK